MRATKGKLEYYVNMFNSVSNKKVELDIAYGGYKIVWCDTRDDVTPYRMTARECFYVIQAMCNTVNEMR